MMCKSVGIKPRALILDTRESTDNRIYRYGLYMNNKKQRKSMNNHVRESICYPEFPSFLRYFSNTKYRKKDNERRQRLTIN